MTVADAHPGSLDWMGSAAGHRCHSLGVEHFGQSGSVPEPVRSPSHRRRRDPRRDRGRGNLGLVHCRFPPTVRLPAGRRGSLDWMRRGLPGPGRTGPPPWSTCSGWRVRSPPAAARLSPPRRVARADAETGEGVRRVEVACDAKAVRGSCHSFAALGAEPPAALDVVVRLCATALREFPGLSGAVGEDGEWIPLRIHQRPGGGSRPDRSDPKGGRSGSRNHPRRAREGPARASEALVRFAGGGSRAGRDIRHPHPGCSGRLSPRPGRRERSAGPGRAHHRRAFGVDPARARAGRGFGGRRRGLPRPASIALSRPSPRASVTAGDRPDPTGSQS